MKSEKPWLKDPEANKPPSTEKKPWQHPPRIVQKDLRPDLAEAGRFLSLLDANEQAFTFSAYDDTKQKRASLTENCMHGALSARAAQLAGLNNRRAGIFVMVNAGDGENRAGSNVKRIRAVWGEFDKGLPDNLPLEPSIKVESSPGKFHCYWLCDELAIAEHRPIMERICRDWRGDHGAKDESRVLRVPGFWHRKGDDFQVRIVDASGEIYSRDDILRAFPPYVEERKPSTPTPAYEPQDDDEERLESALSAIPAEEYHTWIAVGMALKAHKGNAGRSIWERWSASSEKYDARMTPEKWDSFQREGVTVASIFHIAKQNGWKWHRPVPVETVEQRAMIERLVASFQAQLAAKETADPADVEPAGENVHPFPVQPAAVGEFIFDGQFSAVMPPALIRSLLPRTGLVIDGGQSGAGKTFAEVDMAVALASGQDWFGHPVREQIGVVYIAAEGQASIQRRFIAAKRHRGIEDEILPIAIPNWRSVNLRDPKGRIEIIKKLHALALQMKERFDVRLGCIIVDTISASCPMKEENSNAEIAIVCGELRQISDAVGCVMVGVHHFGKAEDSGLRGGSAWRANCDHSRIFLATRDGPGTPARDRRMSLDKNRLGPEGETFEFDLAVLSFGRDIYGDEMSECAIDVKGQAARKQQKLSKPEVDFLKAFRSVLAAYQHTEAMGLRPDERAVPVDEVRDKFEEMIASGQERLSKKQAEARRAAWNRSFKAAQQTLFMAETVSGIEWVWPAQNTVL